MATHKLSAILIKYFTTFVYSYGDHLGLRDFHLLYDFPALFFLPLRHAQGLGVADLHARVLGFANLRVVRPKGFN
jgi:hypothetical protein